MLKKYTIRGIIILVAIIAGFIFLLMGCLASYDERSAISTALFFEKDGKGIVFTIVKYGKATSYKSNGGSTYKRLSTNYLIQANDAETGELISNKKIKHNSDVKFHPVTTMGSGNGKAWVFIGELLAYDPFTLEKFADKEIIEAKNPQLKGKMPDEKTYYVYNNATDEILMTASDGVKYMLSTGSLVASAINEEDIAKSPLEMRDADKDRQRQVEDLNRGSKSYTTICTAVDTFNGKWYGLLSNADLEKPDDRFRYRAVYTETARNKMYTALITVKDSTRKAVELLIAEPGKINDAVYLQGGFLLNRSNALPIHTRNEDGFIICYREKVGNEGNIILTRVDLNGNTKWTFNTKLNDFTDWIYSGKRLIILGNDNKELSSGEANLLLSIDMQNGKAVMHDYFKNAMRKE